MHIGLIGGIGPAATDFYYRGLINAMKSTGQELQLTMAHADAAALIKNLEGGQHQIQAEIYRQLGSRLKQAGADVCVITSIGGHFCIDAFRPISPLPLVDLIATVKGYLQRHDIRRVGLIGTELVMRTKFYQGLGSVDVLIPPETDLNAIHEAYVGMAMDARASKVQREIMFEAGAKLAGRGAETVLLGGTDLFLAFDGQSPDFPVTDCAEVHIREIVKLAADQQVQTSLHGAEPN